MVSDSLIVTNKPMFTFHTGNHTEWFKLEPFCTGTCIHAVLKMKHNKNGAY